MYSVVFAIAALSVAASGPQQPAIANAKPTYAAQHRPAQVEQVPVPKLTSTQIPGESSNTRNGKQEKGQPDQKPIPWYDHNWVGGLATLLSVGVNVIGLSIISRQVELSERAAVAARRSARAAASSVRSYMRSERAWLVIGTNHEAFHLVQDQMAYFHWVICNAGKTTARLIDMQCVCEAVLRTDIRNLPEIPKYGDPLPLNNRQLVPGDTFTHYTPIIMGGVPMLANHIHLQKIGEASVILRAYGYVRYLDAFDQIRESRFCEFHHRPTNTTIPISWRPLLGVPAEYTKNT